MQLSARTAGLTQIFVLLILVLLVYANTLHVPFYFDDRENIQENSHIRMTTLSGADLLNAAFKSPLRRRPVANLSFAVNYYFQRYKVEGYHAVNIIIHILAGIFLYLLLKKTLLFYHPAGPQDPHNLIPFFAAALWLLHPVQTQSVTYIVQRMNSMAAMFYILSLLLYVTGRSVSSKGRMRLCFACSLLAGLLALGSKEIAVTLPFIILLYEWYFFQDLNLAWLKRRLPYFLGLLCLLVSFIILYLGSNPWHAIISGYAQRDFTPLERVLTEFRIIIHYLSLLLYPDPSRLNLDYDFSISHSLWQPPTTVAALGAILALLFLAVYLARKERLISFCILWFLGNLVLESSIIGLELVFEHRLYLPSMFFPLVITVPVFRYIKAKWLAVGMLGGMVLLFSVWTYERNEVWADPVSFWQDCIEKAPDNYRAYNNLGNSLGRKGRFADAIPCFTEALRINPDYAQAHNNLGNALLLVGKHGEAIKEFTEALRIRPDYVQAHNNLGNALLVEKRLDDAARQYSEALRLKPDYAGPHYNLGLIYARQKKFKQAILHLSEALRIEPNNDRIRHNLERIRQHTSVRP